LFFHTDGAFDIGAGKNYILESDIFAFLALKIPLMPGRYEYKFIVDGQWREDPENPNHRIGDHGQNNSILEVG